MSVEKATEHYYNVMDEETASYIMGLDLGNIVSYKEGIDLINNTYPGLLQVSTEIHVIILKEVAEHHLQK